MPTLAQIRHSHLVRTDPDGAWVAEHEGGDRRLRARPAARGRVGALAARRPSRSPVRRPRAGAAGAGERVRGRRARADHPLLARTRGRCAPTPGWGSSCIRRSRRPGTPRGVTRAGGRARGRARTTSRSPRPSTGLCAAPRTAPTSARSWQMGQTLLVSDRAYCRGQPGRRGPHAGRLRRPTRARDVLRGGARPLARRERLLDHDQAELGARGRHGRRARARFGRRLRVRRRRRRAVHALLPSGAFL